MSSPIPNMFEPLTDEELDELEDFLLNEVDSDEAMTLDILDGYLHAIVVGPTTLMPNQWLPTIWGDDEGAFLRSMQSSDQINHVLSLIMRHYNSILANLQRTPCEFCPQWTSRTWEGKNYEDAEGWALGFVDGMKLCLDDWKPLLETPQGLAWYRPIGLLGAEDFGPEQDEQTKTPAQRGELALQIPESVVAMYEYWLPYRTAAHERNVAKTLQTKVGRNDPCPCGSEKKFKKCCGTAGTLH